jgi:hypothetical protein
MDIISLKRKLINFYINSRGWRTNRKIIVIESDDWGSIRMPSKHVYDELLAQGFPVDKLSYLKYDSLESNSDLESLFQVLSSYRDTKGNHPVITANTIMTNPDFDKIRESGYIKYCYELFTETLKHYPEHDRVFDLYQKGFKEKIFYPQLHGLEHLNVRRWMNSLRNENSTARIAFDYELFDLGVSHTEITEDSFIDALSPENRDEIQYEESSLFKAAELFKEVFGYESITFIAPCYIWLPELEKTLCEIGVKNIQSGIYQLVPKIGQVSNFKKKLHYSGERNLSLTYTVRNCFFEPSTNNNSDVIDLCLTQIERAFKKRKPAIIASHRVNYIGYINESNRTRTLGMLDILLNKLLKKWPDVEFLTSDELARMLN